MNKLKLISRFKDSGFCPGYPILFYKKTEDLGKKHNLPLMFKPEVEPNTLTNPPGSFNLRDQKVFAKKGEKRVKKKSAQGS